MLWYPVILLATLTQWAEAQCVPTASIVVGPDVSTTVSAQTYAEVQSRGTAVVLECGTASVTNSGLVTLSGGTATLNGFTWWAQAEATITSRGRILYANEAQITVAPKATAIIDSGGELYGTIGDGGYVSVSGRPGNGVSLTGGDITVFASDQVNVRATAAGARLYLTGSYGYGGVFATGATVVASLTSGGVDAADGGVATLMGSGGMVSMGPGGTATVGGTEQWIYCYESGSADILGGASNSGDFGEGCSGTLTTEISGVGNTVTLSSLASATIAAGATATAFPGAGVYVLGDATDIRLENQATATMVPGARVTAASQGIVQGSGPFVRIRSDTEVGGSTVFTAEQGGTNFRRGLPAPTPRCPASMITCPDLGGGFRCTDTQTDIFNCGGCNFGPGSLRVGIDCTEGSDGDVACVAGRCLAI